MELEFEELTMHPKVREDIRDAFFKQAVDLKFTENEVWHCAIEQVNAVRILVADQCALLQSRLKRN